MKYTLTLTLMLSGLVVFGQSKKKQDQEAIKGMCGCYEVTFEFAETFSPDKDYKFHDNYKSGGLEWVQIVEDKPNLISMQHLLIVGDEMIVKHWRQDWLYQNTSLYNYNGGNQWLHKELSKKGVKGQWTQKVYQVDDGLRYEGSGSWIHADGRHYWEHTSDAPLPRREFSKRSDYNVMARTNRHELTDYGWLHEQDNDKVLRANGTDKIIAEEKGWNTYKKVEDSKCLAAQNWWAKNSRYWSDVRQVWSEVYATKTDLSFEKSVEDQPLFMHLFKMGDEVAEAEDYNQESIQEKVREIIQLFKK